MSGEFVDRSIDALRIACAAAPRFLCVCLFVGGFGYVLLFTTAFVPGLDQMLAYRIVSGALGVPAIISEFGICFWLLIKGAAPASASCVWRIADFLSM